ncbi:hypothetical protein F8S12_25350 [Nostoc sp. WHI]|nr:baseplate J/gp47 family protein [Nostoc sp. WHI]MBG1269466.1 hypothetical protein [Nostoc sp. WHI]
MAPSKDRREHLIASTTLNGIDFVEIAESDQKTLRVHFLNSVVVQGSITNVTIAGGETIGAIAILNQTTINDPTHWTTETATGQPILILSVASPGDFSHYTLTLESNLLDPFFSRVIFSFKALCPSDLDCQTPDPICPPDKPDIPPIDYLAKDFLSFRKALSDFSALRYPEWQERSEADFGVMFLEALCALADDLSYTQDRIAAEATLETATQRRSLVHHARLVDYEPRPATAARVLLQFDVANNTSSLAVGLVVSAQSPDGEIIEFETGTGLVDPKTGKLKVDANTGLPKNFAVNSRFNRHPGITPYWWDDSQRCLKTGATEMWIQGHGFNFQGGEAILIETAGATSADAKIQEVVHLLKAAIEETDALFNQPVTHIFWQSQEALKFDHDLTRTILAGNLVPATQGRRYSETFTIPIDSPPPIPSPLALMRTGANSTPDDVNFQYFYTVRNGAIAFLGEDNPEIAPLPEILLRQSTGQAWIWQRKLLNAKPFEKSFTVDPVSFRRIAPNSDRSVMFDYDSDAGDTIRFGDGIFGELPNYGDTFEVTYRVGGGAIGNVAADTINRIDPTVTDVIGVTNPLRATGGADAEPNERVRRLAPQAFRAKQFRAVRAQDYQVAAQSLPWVQRAGTVFRWTGSWLTVFTTPDPLGSEAFTIEQHTELIDLLNRYRLAGYESYVPSPRYVSLDLEIRVCARPDAFRGDVEADLLVVLSATKFPNGRIGFFWADRWSFGQPLERSALEAAIQQAYGVAGVVSIRYRQRGITSNDQPLPETFVIPLDAILRVDNDNSRPERGSLNIIVEGGK